MLKNIRLHLDKNETVQRELDKKLAQHIVDFRHKNINAFQRNIPSLLSYLQNVDLKQKSLFHNKFGEINIVDYGLGRTFYGFHPQEEVSRQVEFFQKHSPRIDLENQSLFENSNEDSIATEDGFRSLANFKRLQQQGELPEAIDCLVILGCGLGHHVKQLLSQHRIKYLIVYEPQVEFFQCSVMAIDWGEIFELGKKHGTGLFLQLGKDGRDLISDVKELLSQVQIDSFYLYKHYNHFVFDSIFKELINRNWLDICQNGLSIDSSQNYLNYIPNWTSNFDIETHDAISQREDKFEANLAVFQKFFPDIYQQYKNYSPNAWLPIRNQNNEINILNKEQLCTWYGESPKQDCYLNFQNFNSQPNKDGLVLGYTGKKLAHYSHYKFVNQTEDLLKEAEEEIGELPETIASIIMFGLGVGYQLESLLDEHKVEKLFICEPNPDFFYASLYAIDWVSIFSKIEDSDSRIYLNIGDDGTNLFRDLLNQFHSIGPYILNNTYFYQSYYNASLNTAIAQLREQLQVVISMGEYFDHAFYGIAHTKEAMRREYPVLSNNPSEKLDFSDKQVPVFIIGNGPSLDQSIKAIKNSAKNAILISCGTALQALYKNGITPDLHAEIEQNRSTYDWPTLIGDLEYLKKITLVSCNGIHPDTCELYKDVLIAFKEGESSTVSALSILQESRYGVLKHAFPTVSNFVCNLVSMLGFSEIYLLGVDLGFVDVKHHHSKSSGYYEEGGDEKYDYAESNNTSLVVTGNFRPQVNTKHEFKVSRQIIEQVTVQRPKEQVFYNCSDGARISNTTPLPLNNLLILNSQQQKTSTINKLKSKVFITTDGHDFIKKFEKKFDEKHLLWELSAFEKLLESEVSSSKDVQYIINKQKEMLFASYKMSKSLLFYYFYGTVNYANALLLKLSLNYSAEKQVSASVLKCIECWKTTVAEMKRQVTGNFEKFDTCEFYRLARENLVIKSNTKNANVLVVTNSTAFAETIKQISRPLYDWLDSLTIVSLDNINKFKSADFDFSLFYFSDDIADLRLNDTELCELAIQFQGTRSTVIATDSKIEDVLHLSSMFPDLQFLPSLVVNNADKSPIIWNKFSFAGTALKACLSEYSGQVVIPKFIANKNEIEQLPDSTFPSLNQHSMVFDYYHHLVICSRKESLEKLVSNFGSRGEHLEKIRKDSFILMEIEPEEYVRRTESQAKRNPYIFNDLAYNSTDIVDL